MPVTVTAGTINPIDLISDPETGLKTKYRYPNIRRTVTNITLQPEGLFDRMRDFLNLWQHTSEDPPSWISCPEDELLQAALMQHFKITDGPPDPDHPDTVLFDWGDENGDNITVRELVEEGLEVNADIGAEPAAAAVGAPDAAPDATTEHPEG